MGGRRGSETWQLKLQTTGVFQYKRDFRRRMPALCLLTNHEYSRTVTATFYGGVRLWQSGDSISIPEMALGRRFPS